MKKIKGSIILSVLFICTFGFIVINGCSKEQFWIRGNRQIEIHHIQISDYDEVKIFAPVRFDYSQSDSAPYLEVTTDQNIYEHLEIYVQGRTLYIEPQRVRNGRGAARYNLQPTVLNILSNSTTLAEVDNSGSGTFQINSPLTTQKLEIDLSGSGKIYLNDTVRLHTLEAKISGSGKIIGYSPVYASNFDGRISGSGNMDLRGDIDYGEVKISGSGNVDAPHCSFRDFTCQISGSGRIKATITHSLRYQISGSGHLYYHGSPSVSGNISGSGRVIPLDK